MGAQQSTGSGANTPGSAPAKRCYYEVLGVDRHATDDDIKKAYRRKALELHPDRNYGAVEAATTAFAEVSSAYEVLSDPQERSWYDSHRESILRGDSGGPEEAEHNVRVTSAATLVSLMGRFNSRTPFTDTPTGFFGILDETFAQLAKEEEVACDWEGLEVVDYPPFGGSKDAYDDGVRDFYRVWINFSTKKTFSWREEYRASDAPDRQMRRLIEKENKRLRDEGIREFNDAVRSLVAFVRKRDPRYTPNIQSDADRQRVLRDAAAAQAARTRAANKVKLDEHVLPDWAQTQKTDEREGSFSSDEEEIVQQIECVVCDKVFRSEKQYQAHEKSKKHIKAVQQLQRQMRAENRDLDLESVAPTNRFDNLDLQDDEGKSTAHESRPEEVMDEHEDPDGEVQTKQAEQPAISPLDSSSHSGNNHARGNTPPSDSSDVDSEYAPRKEVEARIATIIPGGDASAAAGEDDENPRPKVGKAKVKRAKKLARLEKAAQEDALHKCVACGETFASKTRLFTHLKDEGHAEPVPKMIKKAKNKIG